MIINEQIKESVLIQHNNKQYSVCLVIGDNQKIFSVKTEAEPKKFLGFNKPEISVNRIHHGKVLINTPIYIGLDYH